MSRAPDPQEVARWERPEVAYPLLGPVAAGVARLLFAIEVTGLGHLPRRGPAVVAANHVSHLDPLVLHSVLRRRGRRPRFVALEDLWSVPVVGWLLEHGRMIPVRRGAGADPMVRRTRAALAADQVVVIYPEGTLARPGQDLPPRPGASLLALEAGCPVVPVAMRGVPPYRGGVPRPRRPVDVRVGPPLDLAGLADLPDPAARRAAGRMLLEGIRRLG